MPWRVSTSPRSISVVIERLKALLPLEGLDWNKKSTALTGFVERKSGRELVVYPVRRAFVLSMCGLDEFKPLGYVDADDFMAAGRDTADIQARARMAMDVFREYGFATVSETGQVVVTEVGRAVAETDVAADLLLAQLMKVSQVNRQTGKRIFPLQILAAGFTHLDALSIEELGVLTLCDSPNDVATKAMPTILGYREDLQKRADAKDRSRDTTAQRLSLLHARCVAHFSDVPAFRAETVFRDYPDATARLMQYTGLWSWRGVGNHKKLRTAPGHSEKVRLLAARLFDVPEQFRDASPDDYEFVSSWLGRMGTSELPWAQPEKLREVLRERIGALVSTTVLPVDKVNELDSLTRAMERSDSAQELAALEASFRGTVLPLVKQHYTDVLSKTEAERREILELLQRIESDQQEHRALWLEAATWRALSSLNSAPLVQHGCRFDENLNPLSFGPGGAGSPDMYAQCGTRVMVAEVTTLRNNDQWIKEGASVIDHVQTLMQRFSGQDVVGVFICPAIYYRTLWQFYILSRESWLGRPIPVVPLTLPQFRSLLQRSYEEELTFQQVADILAQLARDATAYATHEGWQAHLAQRVPVAAK